MRNRFLLLTLLCLVLACTVHAQRPSINGTLVDSIGNQRLGNAVIALIDRHDSLLLQFTRSDKQGNFELKNIQADSVTVQISYPGFADYVEFLNLKAGTPSNLGNVYLTPQSKLLEEVVVRQNLAIRMKGDTVEYKADSFKVQEGASVKDLLKRLPGMQVDKNGKITAQGQTVEKVLVDGEEFFSDDPAVVIENLRADAIDKVQSFDKTSEQSEFTGVDDGTRSKTINLTLKEDKKRGLLGKIVLGGGTDERYSNQAMLNFFKGKKKVSVYGIQSNTGVTGLGWGDRDAFGGGSSELEDADVQMMGGMMMFTGDGGDGDFSDWDNSYDDEGIPRAVKAGAHFSNKWNADKAKANGNYSYKKQDVNAIGNTLTKYLLPDRDSSYYSRESHTSANSQQQHLFNGLYDVKIDSTSSLRFKINGKLDQSRSETFTNTSSLDEQLAMVNNNVRRNSYESDGSAFLGSVLWRQKLRKKGRTLSVTASYKRTKTDQDGYLTSFTDYYLNGNGNPYQRDTIDQYKLSNFHSDVMNTKAVYTEPAGKRGILEFNYAFARTASVSDRKSFDNENGKYEALNDLYSIKYGLQYITNSAGAKYQYNGKKLSANIGSNIGLSNYTQNDSVGHQVRQYHYTNLFPNARITYKLSGSRMIRFNYTGTPRPPSVQQLQPILENSNPLFIQVGNPNLRQAFGHNISLSFNSYDVLSGRSIWANASFSPQQHAIVSSSVIDASGKTTMQYINTDGNYNYYSYVSYGFKLKKLDLNFDLSANFNGSRYASIINGVRNTVQQQSIGFNPGIYKYKPDSYDFGLRMELAYNFSNSLNSNFLSQDYSLNFNYYLGKKFGIGSDVDMTIRQKTDAFQANNNLTIWNANVFYKIFKKRNGMIRFEMHDILKQRRGYERDFDNSHITERNYNMLGRYGMLSLIWNFTKSPAGTPVTSESTN